MARSSPGVKRVAAILNFMADHPGQAFALTDLIRALKLSRATCHALLTGLVEVGYLYRTTDKSYVLGPGLAKICQAATGHFSPLQVAQPEMRALADAYDVVCSAFFREGDTVVVRDRASSASHVGFSVPSGTRLTLRTPFAAPFFAWSDPQEVQAWLDSTRIRTTPEQLNLLERSMAFAREHHFVMFLFNPDAQQSGRPLEQIFGGEAAEFPIWPVTDLQPKDMYRPTAILAPVFDPRGEVAFVMGLMSFNRSITGAEANDIAARLNAACDRITDFIGGRPAASRV